MRRSLISLCALAAASFSGGLAKFSAGSPAIASTVNDNFTYLDTAKAGHVTVDSLKTVVDQLKKSGSGTVTMDSVNKAVAGKKDSAWVVQKISDTAKSIRSGITAQSIGALPIVSGSVNVPGPLNVAGRLRFPQQTGDSAGQHIPCKHLTPGNYLRGDVWCYDGSLINYDMKLVSWREPSTNPDTGGFFTLYSNNGMTSTAWQFQLSPTNTLDFWNYTNAGWIMPATLDASGNLSLKGKMTTASVVTPAKAADVADYVFEPSYKLASLPEVEAFTKEHKHLPEVPSAKEIEKGGLDLAQMNLVLLKKVEELTLHAIEQQKAIEQQRQEMAQVKAELESLKRDRMFR